MAGLAIATAPRGPVSARSPPAHDGARHMRRVTQQLERAGITRADGPGVPAAKRADRVS